MVDPPEPVLANEARVAAAAGVVMDALGLPAGRAFEWIMDGSSLTGIPVLELADLVVLEAGRTGA
ncbi:ANTAR domain-containing protein [Actinomycetospora endophytica]|uniref:ANTAR domain-containing protein n=1 Tax=Actinomycetospora endophytica TaxID=2291215 RepID=A0ABS8PDA6_9PSEU|nr:ANTAR domain-containing protein [Actinomycetospora endophytica]MCD2196260.1 ANTAR domain-containing protein [Actinomycetospora endophytica]